MDVKVIKASDEPVIRDRKFEGNAPEYISRELRECSGIVSVLDDKMLSLNEAILKAKAEAEHEAKS